MAFPGLNCRLLLPVLGCARVSPFRRRSIAVTRPRPPLSPLPRHYHLLRPRSASSPFASRFSLPLLACNCTRRSCCEESRLTSVPAAFLHSVLRLSLSVRDESPCLSLPCLPACPSRRRRRRLALRCPGARARAAPPPPPAPPTRHRGEAAAAARRRRAQAQQHLSQHARQCLSHGGTRVVGRRSHAAQDILVGTSSPQPARGSAIASSLSQAHRYALRSAGATTPSARPGQA